MNTIHMINRDLIKEKLEMQTGQHSSGASDPVTRQFAWRRLCHEQSSAKSWSQSENRAERFRKKTNSHTKLTTIRVLFERLMVIFS